MGLCAAELADYETAAEGLDQLLTRPGVSPEIRVAWIEVQEAVAQLAAQGDAMLEAGMDITKQFAESCAETQRQLKRQQQEFLYLIAERN